MTDAIRFYLPWLLSAITIYMTVLAGNKTRWAWAIGLGNQALWLLWIVTTATWGLLPMNLALWIVYGRNHLKWMKAPPPAGPPPITHSLFEDTFITANSKPDGSRWIEIKFRSMEAMHRAHAALLGRPSP